METRALLVDDEKEFVESLSERLELRLFDVKTAYTGDDAVNLLQKEGVDVVILDVLMPVKDGIETLIEIKKIKPLIQVIMLTGHATVETAISGMKLGAYDYLMKPTVTEDLVAKINSAAQLKRGHEGRIHQAEIQNIIKQRDW